MGVFDGEMATRVTHVNFTPSSRVQFGTIIPQLGRGTALSREDDDGAQGAIPAAAFSFSLCMSDPRGVPCAVYCPQIN